MLESFASTLNKTPVTAFTNKTSVPLQNEKRLWLKNWFGAKKTLNIIWFWNKAVCSHGHFFRTLISFKMPFRRKKAFLWKTLLNSFFSKLAIFAHFENVLNYCKKSEFRCENEKYYHFIRFLHKIFILFLI